MAACRHQDTLALEPGLEIDPQNGRGPRSLLPRGVGSLRSPRIGVYTGPGTSHSWLWFVDLFDRRSLNDVVFLDDEYVRGGLLHGLDVFVVSGGDTFGVARALGREGARAIETFIRTGGVYVGSCAGAYLPMRSSKEYLNWFNFTDIKIANLSKNLPDIKRLKSKACTIYGCGYVFHAVREEVRLRMTGNAPFEGVGEIVAPLYGGAAMVAERPSEVLARYCGFTGKTLFLVDEGEAEKTLMGRAAAITTKMGDGRLFLFGPHFEHPGFPAANELLVKAILWDLRDKPLVPKAAVEEVHFVGEAKKSLLRDIKREISNARIVALGIETFSLQWKIGDKIYEPEKIRVFLEAVWKRLGGLERCGGICMEKGSDTIMADCAGRIVRTLREMKGRLDAGEDTFDLATGLFDALRRFTMVFLEVYFRSVRFLNQEQE